MSFEQNKSQACQVITLFKERMKWGVFSRSIKNQNFPSAVNYDKLYAKVEELTDDLTGQMIVNAICGQLGSLKEHSISGEKAVQMATIDSQYLDLFNSYVDSLLSSLPSQDDKWLYELEPSLGVEETPELVCTTSEGGGLVLVFNSTRETTSKEELPDSALTDEFREKRSDNEQIYVIKKSLHRCCDVIFYDISSGILEFRVDNSAGFSANERSKAFHMLKVAFNNYCLDHLGQKVLVSVVELFPAVSALYEIPAGDGRVVELSFTTDEGGIKNNKQRLHHACILEEEFHKGGCAGINNQLTPYKIARVWPFDDGCLKSEPELMLPGTLRMVSQMAASGAILDEFLVTKSVGYSDYRMIVDKLRNVLKLEQKINGHSGHP